MSEHEILEQYVNNFTVKPAYYEQKPQILNHLTYIEESTDKDGCRVFYRKRLKAAYKEVYMVISEIAGEAVCFKTEEYIANMAGCSEEVVSDAKKIFQNSFEQLDGNALMTIDERRVMTSKTGECGASNNVNKRPVHVCGINWVWEHNNAYMKTKKDQKDYSVAPMKERLSFKEAEIAIEKMAQKSVAETVHNSGQTRKNGNAHRQTRKNGNAPLGSRPEKTGGHNTPIQNPFVKEQDPMARAIQMSLINQNDVGEYFVSEQKATEFLELMGFKPSVRNDILFRHSLYEITAAVLYLRQQLEKKEIPSITGYLLRTLENKWWMPKAS